MSDKYIYLSEKEFQILEDDTKWQYVESLMKQIKDYKIQAEKNCEICPHLLMTSQDVNIELFFEDWRDCAEDCEHCNKERLSAMCETQFEIMSHLANSMLELQKKMNGIVKIVLKQDANGSKVLEELVKAKEEQKKKEEQSSNLFS